MELFSTIAITPVGFGINGIIHCDVNVIKYLAINLMRNPDFLILFPDKV